MLVVYFHLWCMTNVFFFYHSVCFVFLPLITKVKSAGDRGMMGMISSRWRRRETLFFIPPFISKYKTVSSSISHSLPVSSPVPPSSSTSTFSFVSSSVLLLLHPPFTALFSSKHFTSHLLLLLFLFTPSFISFLAITFSTLHSFILFSFLLLRSSFLFPPSFFPTSRSLASLHITSSSTLVPSVYFLSSFSPPLFL